MLIPLSGNIQPHRHPCTHCYMSHACRDSKFCPLCVICRFPAKCWKRFCRRWRVVIANMVIPTTTSFMRLMFYRPAIQSSKAPVSMWVDYSQSQSRLLTGMHTKHHSGLFFIWRTQPSEPNTNKVRDRIRSLARRLICASQGASPWFPYHLRTIAFDR